MLQENFHGRNTVVTSRVIRIDLDVWSELQRRAVPFKDNPNSVLRRVLGLEAGDLVAPDSSAGNTLDARVAKLLKMVEARVGQPLAVSPTKSGRTHRFESNMGKVVAFIHQQNHRVKVESSVQMAEEAGIECWDHLLNKGWWGQDSSVYWQIPNDDDDAYDRAAGFLDKLWRL